MEELTEELLVLALELINEYGAEVIYQARESGDYDPATSSASASPGEPETLKALIEDYDLQKSGANYASGLIKSGDKKFTIAGASVADISVGGKLTFNGAIYNVENVKQVYVSATPVLYEVQGRS